MNDQCPCGRARAGCDYHDPTLQPGYEPEPETLRPAEITFDPTTFADKFLQRYYTGVPVWPNWIVPKAKP